MTRYIIDENTFEEIFSLLKKQEARCKRESRENANCNPKRSEANAARAAHISAVIDKLLDAEEIEENEE